ncbi:hypothetical protein QAD02_003311 [Eretmocerus hayati]|uniref:Uncharacterized protein n=1 Tax=Eretmocerus hayati TaxID=131215 RepID=A0ACC2NLT1_9HYME|nr:hypothetical protein QAD02_003311 [Eretmocerus hayati]
MNARTETKGGEDEEEKRNLKDKMINGDEEGGYTYIGPRGNTVIDYLITYRDGKYEIENLRMGNKRKSDHLPLEITLTQKQEELTKEKKKNTMMGPGINREI